MLLWIANEDWEQIERWTEEYHRKLDVPMSYGDELILMALSRVYIAKGKLTDALNLLARLTKDAEAGDRCGRLIEILNLTALALHMQGSTDEALAYLNKSLELAEPEAYMRIFLDEGEPMIQLLKLLRGSDLAPRLKDYVNRLLEAYAPS